jgi:ribosomal protein S18 acetylase RimI-like enzyme
MPMTVRQATVDDAAILAQLLNDFDGLRTTPEQIASRMQACASFLTTWLANLEGHVVGFACLRLLPHLQGDEPYAELTELYVDPPFRRRGVARALITHVDAAAQSAGARDILLITDFTNVGAQDAYRSAGYAVDALAMRKSFVDQPWPGPPLPGV